MALRGLVLGVVWLAALIGPAAALADTGTTLYVDQHNRNCSATAAGTADQPFCTIGAAAAKAAPGTTVVVASGTYPEQVRPTVGGLRFTAAPGATVVVTGGPANRRPSPAFYLNRLNSITIAGFTIKTGATGVYVHGSSNVSIVNNTLTTATLWVRGDAPGATLILTLRQSRYDAAHTLVGEASTTSTLTSQWQPVTVQYTSLDGSPLQLSASILGAPPGTCFYADDASIAVQ